MAHGVWVTMADGSFAALSLKHKIPEFANQAQTTATVYDFEQLRVIINQNLMCMNYLVDFRRNNTPPSLYK
jgi:hypothetical protein